MQEIEKFETTDLFVKSISTLKQLENDDENDENDDDDDDDDDDDENIIGLEALIAKEIKKIDLCSFLGPYYSNDSGTVDEYEVHDVTCNFERGMYVGDAMLILTVSYYRGCKDMNSVDHDLEMKIKYEIDSLGRSILITAEKWPDRDPDEY